MTLLLQTAIAVLSAERPRQYWSGGDHGSDWSGPHSWSSVQPTPLLRGLRRMEAVKSERSKFIKVCLSDGEHKMSTKMLYQISRVAGTMGRSDTRSLVPTVCNRCISVVASGTSTDHSGLCCVTVPIFAPAALGAPESSKPAAPDRPGQRQCRLPRIVFL